MSYLYLFVNLGAIIIPFLYSFHKKLQFNKAWKAFGLSNIISISPFLIWDIIFTEKGIWGFNPDYLTGIYLWNLPLEEVLFFICIPYACVFTWHCFDILYWKNGFLPSIKTLDYILIIGSSIIAITCYNQLYTFYTFLFLALLLLVLTLKSINWLSSFYITYLVLLIPFTIVNGILTGTGIESEIVWYNPDHNFNIRMLSIPIEDIFYGLSLIHI